MEHLNSEKGFLQHRKRTSVKLDFLTRMLEVAVWDNPQPHES